MPWCDDCSRFLTPTSMGAGGECPTCGRVVAVGEGDQPNGVGAVEEPTVPWHFKLLVLATVLYLGWRLVQGVAWVVGRL